MHYSTRSTIAKLPWCNARTRNVSWENRRQNRSRRLQSPRSFWRDVAIPFREYVISSASRILRSCTWRRMVPCTRLETWCPAYLDIFRYFVNINVNWLPGSAAMLSTQPYSAVVSICYEYYTRYIAMCNNTLLSNLDVNSIIRVYIIL